MHVGDLLDDLRNTRDMVSRDRTLRHRRTNSRKLRLDHLTGHPDLGTHQFDLVFKSSSISVGVPQATFKDLTQVRISSATPIQSGNSVEDLQIKPSPLGNKRVKFPQIHASIIPQTRRTSVPLLRFVWVV